MKVALFGATREDCRATASPLGSHGIGMGRRVLFDCRTLHNFDGPRSPAPPTAGGSEVALRILFDPAHAGRRLPTWGPPHA